MTPERWQQIERVYHAALARDAATREAFVADACGEDHQLRVEVDRLLAAHRDAGSFGDAPIAVPPSVVSNRLATGTQFGIYRIDGLLETGGMGEVYRARDTKLGRDVAVKMLPTAFTSDPDRRTRFVREARLLASLNHPNIAQVYGLEESGSIQALVMELVPGQTLAEIIAASGRSAIGARRPDARRGLPVAAALAIARQIAEALEAAHEKGIIHRDLKPANIMIQGAWGPTPTRREDGRLAPTRSTADLSNCTVKVLDFGLAKLTAVDGVGADLSQSPTMSADGTRDGLLLGTAAYMSPQQARGQTVDARADIWAFGCVLYEMLTGRRAFEGDCLQDTLAAVLTREPDFGALPDDTPGPIRVLLRRCLEKDPRQRLHDIADARIEIDDRDPATFVAAGSPDVSSTVVVRARKRERLAWLTAALAGAAVFTVGGLYLRRPQPPADPVVFTIDAPEHSSILADEDGPPAISPDGRSVAFVTPEGLRVRPLASAVSQELPGTKGAARPFWSPDGRHLGFEAGRKLMKIDVAGGNPVPLCDASRAGGTWNRDGVILFSSLSGPLQKVSSDGGTPTPVTTMGKNETRHWWPWFLPDGQHFLYLAIVGDARELRVGSLTSAETKPLGSISSNAMYGSGYLFFRRRGSLMAQPFDADGRRTTGEPVLVAASVAVDDLFHGAFSVSTNGVLDYVEKRDLNYQLTWKDRTGTLLNVVGDPALNATLNLSPDEDRVAVASSGPDEGVIWVLDLFRNGAATRITFAPLSGSIAPAWSPDGKQLVFCSANSGVQQLFRSAADGSGKVELLLKSDRDLEDPDWSQDGRFLVYPQVDKSTGRDLWTLPISSDGIAGTPSPFLQTQNEEDQPAFSPDGHWIAYASNSTGRREVYVRPFPKKNGLAKVSVAGGEAPRWRGDGKELFFVAPDGMLMSVDTSAGFQHPVPKPLFKTDMTAKMGWSALPHGYAVSKNGQRFLLRVPERDSSNRITVVVNWPATIHK